MKHHQQRKTHLAHSNADSHLSSHCAGFDKQMDVVSLFDAAGHSPACFWIGGFESNAANNVGNPRGGFFYVLMSQMFSWNISGNPMEQYFTEWESGYPKNRSKNSQPSLPSFAFYFPSEAVTQDLPAVGFAV